MSDLLKDKALVIGIASSALFDLAQSDEIFREQGVTAYEQYQNDHIDEPFQPGVAFPFISRLLRFNDLFDDRHKGVEVIVLSRNSPKTGLRVMNSIEHYHLGITRAVFRGGRSTFPFMDVFNMSLFLSANAQDVDAAVTAGQPAGCVLPYSAADTDDDGNELRVAFDFDGVLFRRSAPDRIARWSSTPNTSGNTPINPSRAGHSNDCSPVSTPCRKPPPAAQWKASRRCECI